ncbi:hypothetical protein [Chitinophaga nivalis]|uniref:SusD-like N-terminal domain-containing protein n=1 Tax=Chitinophaga nivalis TaxID=2991709 RepID=A0ABT3IIU3_9BACT|nr:hypothetical protein [Chitinophaga nivalis]MCW3466455.1 hypothetical protein [Chitinophaga nivalis]MCW3483854.1 hypothetical protein [Chitinophaga nivalis]
MMSATLLFACQKENLQDPAVYKWERQLILVSHLNITGIPDISRSNYNNTFPPNTFPNNDYRSREIVVQRDVVRYTMAQMAQERDSIQAVSNGIRRYKYIRI